MTNKKLLELIKEYDPSDLVGSRLKDIEYKENLDDDPEDDSRILVPGHTHKIDDEQVNYRTSLADEPLNLEEMTLDELRDRLAPPAEELFEIIRRGDRYIEEGKLKAGKNYYVKIFDSRTKDPDILREVARRFLDIKNFTYAKLSFEKLFDVIHYDREACTGIIASAMKQIRHQNSITETRYDNMFGGLGFLVDGAREYLDEAGETRRYEAAYLFIGYNLLERDKIDEALPYFKKGLQIQRSAKNYYGIAYCYLKMGEISQAKLYAKKADEAGHVKGKRLLGHAMFHEE